jgi:hypothetical protein
MRTYLFLLLFVAGLLLESCKTVNPPKNWSRNTHRPNKAVNGLPRRPATGPCITSRNRG